MAQRPEAGEPWDGPSRLERRPEGEAWPAPGETGELHPRDDGPPTARIEPPLERPAPYAYPPAVPAVPVMPLPTPAGFGFRPQTEPSAVLALVLAILAWIACPVLAAIAALMIAGGAKAKIDIAAGALTGAGLVSAARWLAWIHLGLMVLGIFLLIFRFPLFGSLT